MTITIHGNTHGRAILAVDADKPNPRTLLIKLPKAREMRVWQKKSVEATEINDVDARDAAYDTAFADVVVGWENIDREFSIASLREEFYIYELLDFLLNIIPGVRTIEAEDKKKSASAVKSLSDSSTTPAMPLAPTSPPPS